MFAFDLTDTAVATGPEPVRSPDAPELFAITVALLNLENLGLGELPGKEVVLTHRNRRRIAQLIEQRTPSLARAFGGAVRLRQRLEQLVGLRILANGVE